ncbi:MAG: hypothetical protein F6J93_07365 [Oscillatoria sp. SIO1A7]|nr:hypothetical protein [Oscillatoria sp. SIO1A7]
MQKLCKVLVALLVAVALTWIPSFASAPALAGSDTPGLQFAIQPGTGKFVQFQTSPIVEGEPVVVSFDSLRVSDLSSHTTNPECGSLEDLDLVTGYVMSGDSGDIDSFPLVGGSLKLGAFTTPECYEGSEEIQIWFIGYDEDGSKCYDSAFSKNYHFPVICQEEQLSEEVLPEEEQLSEEILSE